MTTKTMAMPGEHDAVGLQSSRHRGLDVLYVDLRRDAIVHACGLSLEDAEVVLLGRHVRKTSLQQELAGAAAPQDGHGNS